MKRKLVCEECEKEFDIYSSWYSHRRLKHQDPQVQCFHCDKTFRTVNERNTHFYKESKAGKPEKVEISKEPEPVLSHNMFTFQPGKSLLSQYSGMNF